MFTLIDAFHIFLLCFLRKSYKICCRSDRRFQMSKPNLAKFCDGLITNLHDIVDGVGKQRTKELPQAAGNKISLRKNLLKRLFYKSLLSLGGKK